MIYLSIAKVNKTCGIYIKGRKMVLEFIEKKSE